MTRTRALAAALALILATAGAGAAADVAPIVGGAPTTDDPAVGALVVGADPGAARTECTVALVGCRTAITAAHCVCPTTGAACQDAAPVAGAFVYFAHAGFFAIEQATVHPDFAFPAADVAVLRLATPVSGIAPLRPNDVAAPPLGTSARIVGFGWQTATARDTGIKRSGSIVTAPCLAGVSDASFVCWDYHGAGANTCEGDSGGPLLVDFGEGPLVAGVTSGGVSTACLPTDHSYDTSLFAYRDWLATAIGADLGTTCDGGPVVGAAGVIASAFTGTLDAHATYALHSIGVAPGTAELRVAMNAVETPGTDFDLYVRGGAAPAVGAFDCAATGTGQYAFCRVTAPQPGSWYVRAERVRGDGRYQLVATTIGGALAVCGNGLREPGESCDGADTGTCSTGCDAGCRCVECATTDLDVRQIQLAPRAFVQATLGDAVGTYTAVDPASAGVTIDFIDATHDVPLVVPPRDPGWVLVNPRRGRYRWQGGPRSPLRRLAFRTRRGRPTQWNVELAGRNLPGAATIDYRTLTVRIRLGTRCAERRFHADTPAIPR